MDPGPGAGTGTRWQCDRWASPEIQPTVDEIRWYGSANRFFTETRVLWLSDLVALLRYGR